MFIVIYKISFVYHKLDYFLLWRLKIFQRQKINTHTVVFVVGAESCVFILFGICFALLTPGLFVGFVITGFFTPIYKIKKIKMHEFILKLGEVLKVLAYYIDNLI
jgi:hypothetical protein